MNHYESENDIFLGLYSSENKAHKVCQKHLETLGEGWKKGDLVNGNKVEFISFRIDSVSTEKSRKLTQSINETYVDFLKRVAKETKYTACICRRFVNEMNSIRIVDCEVNGATKV